MSTLMPSVTAMRWRSTYGRHLADVLDRDDVAPVESRARLGGHHEVDHRARAHAELDTRELSRASANGDDVPADRVGDLGVLELLACLVETDDAEQRANLAEHVGRDALVREVEHRELGLRVGVLELDLEEEAVELALRERMHSLVLMRVLRGDHEERVGQLVRLAVDRDLALAHRLEEGGLRAGRRTVDLVCEEDVREDGTGEEEVLAGTDDVLAVELGRCRVGCELDALERRAEHVRDARASSVFALPGGPSRRTWPCATAAIRSSSTVRSWPMTTFATSAFARSRRSARSSYFSSIINATTCPFASFEPASSPGTHLCRSRAETLYRQLSSIP